MELKWKLVPESPTEAMIAAAGGAADHLAAYLAMLAAAPEPPYSVLTADQAKTFQAWKGMDGATAFHLIERHAEGWSDVARMMDAWMEANR